MIGVRLLTSILSESDASLGNKVINLAKIISCFPDSDYVLPGFCVTFDAHNNLQNQMQLFASDICKHYYNLIKNGDNNTTVIVRSSADQEDGSDALYPGVLKSFSGISNISMLQSAILECVSFIESSTTKKYADIHGIDNQVDFFTVLIQIELQPEYSGVAFTRLPFVQSNSNTMITQMAIESNHDLVQGLGKFNTYTMTLNQETINHNQCLERAFYVDQAIEQQILEMLGRLMIRLKDVFHNDLDIEWGYAGGKLYIYQARMLKANIPLNTYSRCISAFRDNAEQGLKYQAMSFFVEYNLFQEEALFFPKDRPLADIRLDLLRKMPHSPLTVRFSCGNDIGLPRFFTKTPEEAIDKIEALKQDDWSIIVYPSINVKESYELYMDHEKTVLEYVPGMWESDSHLLADTTVLIGNSLKLWSSRERRVAKYENSKGVWTEYVRPTDKNAAIKRFQEMLPTINALRTVFRNDFPLNFHFVSDGERISFLNCRLSKEINCSLHNGNDFFEIRNISDCEDWNGQPAILFCPNLRRGEESIVLEFVPFLKNAGVPIYVKFGILSHPAILLREFGIAVQPYFHNHRFYNIPNYLLEFKEYYHEQGARKPFSDAYYLRASAN